jgi:hypothetical protein
MGGATYPWRDAVIVICEADAIDEIMIPARVIAVGGDDA